MHAHRRTARHDRGFTLLEMGIVIVVVGLIAGGILIGQGMIRSAEVQSIVSDFSKFQAATSRFQSQFASLPGDMPDATSHWGGSAVNGDGDGVVDGVTAIGPLQSEAVQFWKHLQLAKELDISVSGTQQPCANCIILKPGEDAPTSKLYGSIWIPGYNAQTFGAPSTVPASNYILFTGPFEYGPPAPILTPGEALSIDTKIDNGLAESGDVAGWPNTNCTNGDAYRAADENRTCALFFNNAF